MTSVYHMNYIALTMRDATAILKALRALEEGRRRLMDALLRGEELAVGTLRKARRPCGNPRCGRCAAGPSHEQVVFYYATPEGRRTSSFVRRAEEARFEEAARLYADFRTNLRALKQLDVEELDLLAALKASRALDAGGRKG